MPSNCRASNCTSTTVALGLCDRHYRRFKKYGDLNEVHYRIEVCKGCESPFEYAISRGLRKYCSSSCQRKYRRDSQDLCTVTNCTKPTSNKTFRMCSKHYDRMRKNGSVDSLRRQPAKNVKCSVESCVRTSIAKHFCTKHYQMWQKHGDPLGGKFRQKVRKAITHDDGTRTCSECEQRQPLTAFHRDRNATDGYRSKCKTCRLKTVKEWYQSDVPKRRSVAKKRYMRDIHQIRKKDSERYQRDREKRIALATEHSHLRKSRKKKVVSERGISRKSLRRIHGNRCYYCGIEMDFSIAKGKKWKPNMATIEHIVPIARGGEHTFANTVLACRQCNISKNSKLESEFRNQ